MEIAKRLIAVSDIVIENFSSRVLHRWGLGYQELCKIKPDIVYVSMSGYGHTGRNHHYTSFGPVAQAASGLTYLSGLPDKPPAGWGWSYMARIEAALSIEASSAPCPQRCGLVFAPGWWCDDCEACAFPTLLLDSDYEPNGDDEPDDDYA